jgi:hypothetical protein
MAAKQEEEPKTACGVRLSRQGVMFKWSSIFGFILRHGTSLLSGAAVWAAVTNGPRLVFPDPPPVRVASGVSREEFKQLQSEIEELIKQNQKLSDDVSFMRGEISQMHDHSMLPQTNVSGGLTIEIPPR